MVIGYRDHRTAAMALLTSGVDFRPKEGSFLGQVAFTAEPLSERQRRWLEILLDRHGLAPLDDALAQPAGHA